MILTLGGKNETAIVFQPAGMREIELVGVAEIARKLQDFSTAGCINVAMLLVLIESADSQGFSLFDTVSSLALRSSELLLTLTNGLPLSPHDIILLPRIDRMTDRVGHTQLLSKLCLRKPAMLATEP